jgi:acyl-CoA reductase-like NAD-dependent aldehyde dehydrogenase
MQCVDIAKANRLARLLRAGSVKINDTDEASSAPFGGYKVDSCSQRIMFSSHASARFVDEW